MAILCVRVIVIHIDVVVSIREVKEEEAEVGQGESDGSGAKSKEEKAEVEQGGKGGSGTSLVFYWY